MSGTDKIHETQERVATLQTQLDEVQRVLDKAEKVAAVGEAAKQRASQLLGVSIALIAVGILILIREGKKKRGA
jgi:hypothetical protein